MAKLSTYSRKECKLKNGKVISYLEAGPRNGTIFILLHGWPAIGETWRQQLITFAGLGFRVIAPDMPGYGETYKSKDKADFSLESINAGLLDFLEILGGTRAIWAGHDWGAGVLWSLVSHYPQVCIGVITLCVPYQTTELGLNGLIPHINREVYPELEFPHGQWDYWHYYTHLDGHERAVQSFEENLPNFFRAIWSKATASKRGQPSFTAFVSRNGGWFGSTADLPESRFGISLLDQELLDKLVEAFRKGSFWAPTAYYINVDENAMYQEKSVNGGNIEVPVLFLEATWDQVCDTADSTLAKPMREACYNLTEVSIDAGHWLPYEAPEDVNAAIVKWMATTLPKEVWSYSRQINNKQDLSQSQ